MKDVYLMNVVEEEEISVPTNVKGNEVFSIGNR